MSGQPILNCCAISSDAASSQRFPPSSGAISTSFTRRHCAKLKIPAPLDARTTAEAQRLALSAFAAVDAAGYARVDLFLETSGGRLLVNEINTIPGFTSISMFPKLWEASGLAYDELLARLVGLGLERHRQRAALRTTYRK